MVSEREVFEEPEPVYRTRSGRTVRQVTRYEPDENTIFVDEESPESDYLPSSQEEGSLSGDETDETASLTDTDSDTDTSSLSCSDSDLPSLMDDEDLDEDILDWDRLTDDANTDEDQSTEDDDFDDDEEDTEVLSN